MKRPFASPSVSMFFCFSVLQVLTLVMGAGYPFLSATAAPTPPPAFALAERDVYFRDRIRLYLTRPPESMAHPSEAEVENWLGRIKAMKEPVSRLVSLQRTDVTYSDTIPVDPVHLFGVPSDLVPFRVEYRLKERVSRMEGIFIDLLQAAFPELSGRISFQHRRFGQEELRFSGLEIDGASDGGIGLVDIQADPTHMRWLTNVDRYPGMVNQGGTLLKLLALTLEYAQYDVSSVADAMGWEGTGYNAAEAMPPYKWLYDYVDAIPGKVWPPALLEAGRVERSFREGLSFLLSLDVYEGFWRPRFASSPQEEPQGEYGWCGDRKEVGLFFRGRHFLSQAPVFYSARYGRGVEPSAGENRAFQLLGGYIERTHYRGLQLVPMHRAGLNFLRQLVDAHPERQKNFRTWAGQLIFDGLDVLDRGDNFRRSDAELKNPTYRSLAGRLALMTHLMDMDLLDSTHFGRALFSSVWAQLNALYMDLKTRGSEREALEATDRPFKIALLGDELTAYLKATLSWAKAEAQSQTKSLFLTRAFFKSLRNVSEALAAYEPDGVAPLQIDVVDEYGRPVAWDTAELLSSISWKESSVWDAKRKGSRTTLKLVIGVRHATQEEWNECRNVLL